MPHTPIHIATKKTPILRPSNHKFTLFDKIVLFVSVLYPLSALPQAIAVLGGKTEGVSVISWMVFMACATLFLIYGIRRRVPPMIVSNSIWIIMDGLVVFGIFASGSIVTWI